jgi:hypothetical protein
MLIDAINRGPLWSSCSLASTRPNLYFKAFFKATAELKSANKMLAFEALWILPKAPSIVFVSTLAIAMSLWVYTHWQTIY